MFIIVGILVAIVIGLLIYNVQIHRKIQGLIVYKDKQIT